MRRYAPPAISPPTWPRSACVVGLGYVGLPTAAILSASGLPVLGVDTDPAVLEALGENRCPQQEQGLPELLAAGRRAGPLRVSAEPEPCEAFVLCVPTGLACGKVADLSHVIAATERLVPHLRPGCLVVLESTVPPGTTVSVVKPILEQSGLSVGRDVFLAHCPERVMPGQLLRELRENPRLIGGCDARSAELARHLYARFVTGQMRLTDATTAELAKLVENAYRDVNIAFANELAAICERIGADVWEAIELANLHPRVNVLRPGPGVGGHCIPVDPWFLVQAAPELSVLLPAARQVNDAAAVRTADAILDLLGDLPRRVAVLGVAYKGGVADTRGSPAAAVIARLEQAGVRVQATDPHAGSFNRPLVSLPEAVAEASVLALLVDHPEYISLDPAALATITPARRLLDAHHCLERGAWRAAGFRMRVLGLPPGLDQSCVPE